MSLFAFYKVGTRGTVKETSKYDPEKACKALYQSMAGLGTDEDGIIEVVCSHSFHQRQELKEMYQQMYTKNLEKELDSELSFSFAKTVLALMKQPEEYIIECIHQAISKSKASQLLKQLQKIYKKAVLCSDDYSLIGFLCPRSNAELEAIKILYKNRYGNELEDDIGPDLGEDFRGLILDLISGGREDEEEVDLDKVLEDADNLHGASFVPQGEINGTKERVLQQILNSRSYDHIRQLFSAYKDVSNKTIEEYIEGTGLNQNLKTAYLVICQILRSEPDFYAQRLKEAIQGFGTDDDTLINVVVLRSEIDLIDIMSCYYKKYGVTLEADVAGDTSGDYKQIMMKMLTLPDEEGKGGHGRKKSAGMQDDGDGQEEADEVTITAAAGTLEDKEDEDDQAHEDLEVDTLVPPPPVIKVTKHEVVEAQVIKEVEKPVEVEKLVEVEKPVEVAHVEDEEEEETCTTPVPEVVADPIEVSEPPPPEAEDVVEEVKVEPEEEVEKAMEQSNEEKTEATVVEGGGEMGVSGG